MCAWIYPVLHPVPNKPKEEDWKAQDLSLGEMETEASGIRTGSTGGTFHPSCAGGARGSVLLR